MSDNRNSFRRPWMFKSVDCPEINPLWLAEYMHQHDLTMEVALEHLSKKMQDFLKEANAIVSMIDGSDDQLLKECRAFVEGYKPMKDFYTTIPLVQMFKE